MLLNRDPMENHSHLEDHHNHHRTSALFAAAQNGHSDCVGLLLSSGVPADVSDENGLAPLHRAAAIGHHRCVEALLSGGAKVDQGAPDGQTPLYMSSGAGRLECVRALLSAGANLCLTTTDGCTALHAAVCAGHVDTLRLLLCHQAPQRHHRSPSELPHRTPPHAGLLSQANGEGWTAAHIAAARGFKDCLEVLCSHSDQDIETRDKCNRTIHDVATDDCKDLLENLHSYRVSVCVQWSGGGEPRCPLEALEEGEGPGAVGLGCMRVQRATSWAELGRSLGRALSSHLQPLCGDEGPSSLGLTPASMASALIGDTVWLPGQELSQSPWDLVRKPLSQRITIRLKGLSESCLDELALESLIPLPLLQNYVRLVEQYRNVIFHGLEGSCQEYIAHHISRCIKNKQEAGGMACDVTRVEVEPSLTREQLLETFITSGFLVPASSRGCSSGGEARCVVLLLEGLEKARSLSQLLGDLCEGLENRGTPYLLHGQSSHHTFQEGGFLIGTLSKPRLLGAELRLQQHFRWVTLRWDSEPLHGLLGRHLRRKLLHKTQAGRWAPEGLLERTVVWVSQVWQQLNACLSRLGTQEALLGPQLFLSCPIMPDNTQAVIKWLARLWNMVVVPRVEDAIVSRVTVKRPSSQWASPGHGTSRTGLSPGQQAVVKAALNILVNKAVRQGCPLPPHEIDSHLLEFKGGAFPLATTGSCKGSGGGRKGRDHGMWRRANTSPRKKGTSSSSSNWSSGSSLKEGSLSNTDVRFANGSSPRLANGEPVGLSLFSDDETDLIRELQSMCSSKSEPDITKMAQSKDDLIVFSASPSEPEQEEPPSQRPPHAAVTHQPSTVHAAQSGDRRSTPRPKSQLPVPSSRGQQPRASSVSSSTLIRTPTSANRNTSSSRTDLSSKSRQPTPSVHHSNKVNNNISQPHEEVWILHQDLHENIINKK